jgi:NDP-sugar pyrophosphorylase family protein
MFSVVNTVDGLVSGFGGMPAAETFSEREPPLMFTGIQILEPRIFDYIPRNVFSHSTIDVYPQAIARGERVAAHVASGRWFELSTIQRYLEISLQLLAEEGQDCAVGEGSRISPSAVMERSILWDNVEVESGARVKRAVLADNVKIGAGEVIEDAAVVCASLIEGKAPPPKALKGVVRGDNFVVPLTQ